jgi:putative salt-induced outer membrane protein YdiY
VIAALSLLLLAVQADTTRPPPELKFTGEVGYVATAGNQSVKTLNVGDKLSAKFGDLTLTQTFARVYGESEGETTTSLTRASLRVDKGLKASPFVAYGLLNFERNTFAGLASRLAGSAGLSAILVRDERNRVVVESGLSLNRQRGTGTRGRDVDFLGGRAAGTYTHLFAPKASFVQAVEVLPNFRETEDLRINTESTVAAPLTSRIAVKLSYLIRYDGLPETGFLTTDRLFTSGIQVTL